MESRYIGVVPQVGIAFCRDVHFAIATCCDPYKSLARRLLPRRLFPRRWRCARGMRSNPATESTV